MGGACTFTLIYGRTCRREKLYRSTYDLYIITFLAARHRDIEWTAEYAYILTIYT